MVTMDCVAKFLDFIRCCINDEHAVTSSESGGIVVLYFQKDVVGLSFGVVKFIDRVLQPNSPVFGEHPVEMVAKLVVFDVVTDNEH